ncbi:DISARM system SNF2-like helicase DrmD [Nannocystaceae bacterium ST9]
MLTKRSILAALTRKRLLRLREHFELNASPDALLDVLASDPEVKLEQLLEQLNARELAQLCAAHDLESTGDKVRDANVLLSLRPSAEPPAVPIPSPPARPVQPAPLALGHRWRDADPLEPGQIVRVRSRQYLVEDLTAPKAHGDATLVRLSCLEDDALGEPLEVLWECELDARILGKSSWEAVAERGFDRPDLFSAYLHTLRWNCVTSIDPKLFQAPYRAGIQVKDYQLEPLRKALQMPRVRLFIADDVGLGKTIEAGLILREMLMRQRVRRVVVACPPSVVQQWCDEMEQRFGLTFVIVDRAWFAEIRRERGWGANPWKTHSRFVISHALLRDETYAAPLRDQLGTFSPGTLLILDEAHNAAPSSGARYAVDSHLTRTVRDLAPRFEHKLFLSATPHNGHSNSFAALLEILDPQRFCRGVPVRPELLADVMVRRLKADVRELVPGEFAKRVIESIVIDGLPEGAPELELSRLLQQLRELRLERVASTSQSRQVAALLVLTSLQKRLLSSIEAFYRTLDVHRRAIERRAKSAKAERERDPGDLGLLREGVGCDDERADLPELEVELEVETQLEAASAHASVDRPSEVELALLDRMREIAGAHRHGPDARFEHLLAWIREHQCPELGQVGARWLPRRLLIFTEYTDTKRWLLEQLDAAINDPTVFSARVDSYHGGMGDDRREAIKRAFNAHPDEQPLRILVATDAAREGVNLQNHCADLLHFDVPWNPGRMEQRNGRIDRKLQRAERVYCRYFVLPQRAEDKVLDTLVSKTHTINEELGSLTPVIVERMSRVLQRGISHAETQQLSDAIQAIDPKRPDAASNVIDDELESVRRRRALLEREIVELRDMLDGARRWLGLDHRHFRDALSAGLELLGAAPLIPVDAHEAARDPATARWQLPDLDRRSDATWVTTLDSLRPPRERKQKLWDWRRDTQVRPVVFQATAHLDDAVVHLHLEHRVVRRLLGRFLSQGFVHDELTRACVCLTRDAKPKVLALGRLSLYGERATRLHDEIVALTAEWIEPELRVQGGVELLDAESPAAQAVLVDLETSLSEPSLRKVPAAVAKRLRGFAKLDVAALLPQLEHRCQARAKQAQKLLTKRGKDEAKAMVEILAAQRRRIEERIAELDERERAQQLTIDFGDDETEQRQLAADRRYWPKRLAQLAEELVTEPENIRAGYEIKATRVDPVGLVYLWPVSA